MNRKPVLHMLRFSKKRCYVLLDFYGLSVVFDNKRLDVDRIFPSSVHIFSFYRRQTGTPDRLCFVVS